MRKTKIIGHRGLKSDDVQENTIDAFDAAFKLGCDGVEMDVHLSKDKQWIIHHDFNLGGLINHKTNSEALIRKADEKGYKLAFLSDVLEKYHDRELNIEVKPDSFKLGKELGNYLIQNANLEKHYITSFKSETLVGLRKVSTDIKLGWITAYVRTKTWKYLHRKINLYTINPLHYIITKFKIHQILRENINVQPWTVNKIKSIKKHLSSGVDAIITDKPKIALEERLRISS